MKHVITIEVDLPPGAAIGAVRVEPASPDSEAAHPSPASGVATQVEQRVATVAPRSLHQWIRLYLERVAEEFATSVEIPTGKRTDYLNLYPPAGHPRRRTSSITLTSGRTEIYCDPRHAEGRSHAEPDKHNGVPKQVKIYLDSEDAVEEAIELTAIAIEENRR